MSKEMHSTSVKAKKEGVQAFTSLSDFVLSLKKKNEKIQNGLIDLSGSSKNVLHDLVNSPVISPAFAATGACNPNLRVFCVNFDGTMNDADNPGENENASLIWKFHQEADLSSLISKGIDVKGAKIASIYVRGTATSGSLIADSMSSSGQSMTPKIVEGITGLSCEERAQAAFDDIEARIRMIHSVHPDEKFHIHVTGFSRGGATALHFMNLFQRDGVCNRRRDWKTRSPMKELDEGMDFYAIPPGGIPMSAVLIDCVKTGPAFAIGNLMTSTPPCCVSGIHIVANGDERSLYPVLNLSERRMEKASNVSMLSADSRKFDRALQFDPPGDVEFKRLHEIYVPGARHCDVAGIYKEGGFREIADFIASSFRASLGLDVSVTKPSIDHIQLVKANDSREGFLRLIDYFKEKMTGGGRPETGRRRVDVNESPYYRTASNFDAGQVKSANPKTQVSNKDDLMQGFPQAIEAFRLINEPSLTHDERCEAGDILLKSIGIIPDDVVRRFHLGLNGEAKDRTSGAVFTEEILEQHIENSQQERDRRQQSYS